MAEGESLPGTDPTANNDDWEVDVLQNFSRKLKPTNNVNVNSRTNHMLSEFDPFAIKSPSATTTTPQETGNIDDDEEDPLNISRHEYLTDEEALDDEETSGEVDQGDGVNNFTELETTEERSESRAFEEAGVTHMSYSDEDVHNDNLELNNTTKQLRNTTENNNHIDLVTEEYEKSMASMSDEIETWKSRVRTLERDKVELIHERDQTREDLHNIESAFSNLHSKYERMKDVLVSTRKNQNLLESRDLEMQDRLSMSESQIAEMEDEFRGKIASIYASFEARLKNQDLESTRLRAQLRKLEMKNETLENEVKQKSSEVSKLSLLCDELINKV